MLKEIPMLTAFLLIVANQSFTGTVVGVLDGDTIEVKTGPSTVTRVRLADIDAPEKSQAFGYRAKEALSRKVFGEQVDIITRSKDRYGRTVATVMNGNRNINLEMVQDGMAWWYRQYSRDANFGFAEAQARKLSKGLWIDQFAQPPWDYRHPSSRTTTSSKPSSSSSKSSKSSSTKPPKKKK